VCLSYFIYLLSFIYLSIYLYVIYQSCMTIERSPFFNNLINLPLSLTVICSYTNTLIHSYTHTLMQSYTDTVTHTRTHTSNSILSYTRTQYSSVSEKVSYLPLASHPPTLSQSCLSSILIQELPHFKFLRSGMYVYIV